MEWLEDTKIDNRDSIYKHFENLIIQYIIIFENLINFLVRSQKHGSNAKHNSFQIASTAKLMFIYLFFSQLPAPKIQWSTLKNSSLQILEHLAIPPRNIYIYNMTFFIKKNYEFEKDCYIIFELWFQYVLVWFHLIGNFRCDCLFIRWSEIY